MRRGLQKGDVGSEVGWDKSAQEDDGSQDSRSFNTKGGSRIEEVIHYRCEYCGRDDIRSKSGLTLHENACDAKKAPDEDDGRIYCLVGDEPKDHHKKDVFELRLDDFFEDNNLFPAVKEYFVTSGEAIAKTEKLERDAWKLAGESRRLLRILKETRASAKYLETGFDANRALLLKRKNPRKRKRKTTT